MQSTAPPAHTEFKQSLAVRSATAAVAVALSLFALFTTHALPVFLLVGFVSVVGFKELIRLAGLEDRPLAAVAIGLACYVAPVVVAWATPPGSWPFWAMLWVAYLGGCFGVWQALRRGYSTPLCAAWLGAPMAVLLVTQQQSAFGVGSFSANASLMLLVPIWIGDTAALFAGRAFGKRLLAPKISPKKTWEGAIANFVAAVLSAWALGLLLFPGHPWANVLVGAFCGTLGQIGDLAQSAVKRVAGLKDSGDALPGHGGVLDRLDSFLLSSVPSATVLWLMVPGLYHGKLWP